MTIIQEKLFALQDLKYKDFHAKLVPTMNPDRIIGVRTPALKKVVKELSKEDYVEEFLNVLPHQYYEEDNVHGGLLNLRYKDIHELLGRLDVFLPYVDNWATCDGLSPKLFRKYPELVFEKVQEWIKRDETYVRRFAIKTLMDFYMEDAFRPEHLQMVADSCNDEYYVKMMVAWYFSVALVKQYDAAISYIESHKLEPWTHNKSIQKAVESFRVSDEKKAYLKTFRVKSTRK